MNNIYFNEIVEGQCAHIKSVLASKGKEYSRGDRLSNFKTGGRIINDTPEHALMGMKLKHDVSVIDIVDDLEQGNLPTYGVLSEKIGDSINYLILLKALIIERLEIADKMPEV